MKKKKKWIKWVVILVIVAAVVGWFIMVSRKTQDVAYTNVQATLGSIETYYNFDGLVKAKRVQTITAAQSDKVRTVYVTQNQQVKKGERLYRLEGGETVEADIAGEVTGLYVEQGGVVTAGETTAQIIDMNSLEIELNVDEYDVAAVVPGQVVQVNVLAPDVNFTGSVTALNKNGTASGDLSYYTATVAFDAAENVYPGMQVSAKVLKEQAEDAVLLRQDAVQFDDYNKPYVLVRGADGKSVEQKSVTVGVSDGMNCEITSGLNAGDTVLKSSGVTMAELMEQMHAQQRTGRWAEAAMSNDFFKMRGIVKQYQMGNEVQTILKGIDLDIEEGEFLSILGPSGSGKSTLMNIIGCLDTPTSGEYILHGRMIRDLDENQLAHIRSKEIGFIFQQFQLLPRLDALKNVELPLIYAGVPPRERTRRAEEMLVRVGLKDRMHHYQNQLSGGQQQRVAIARALATNPTLLLADEPTGALDQATGEQVMALFRELNDEGRTIVMITHDLKIARHASRIVNILDGVLSEGVSAYD